MDSPFHTYNSHCVLYLEPFFNTFHKTYQNIISINSIPDGPLANFVTSISTSKLSPFQQITSIANNPSNCIHVLLRYPKHSHNASIKNTDFLMGHDDIPSVLSYLHTNGYIVDTQLTKMLSKNGLVNGTSDNRTSGNKKMLCIIRYTP